MSKNSKLKRDRKKKQKKNSGPGSSTKAATNVPHDDNDQFSHDVTAIKDPVKTSTARQDVPTHPPIERRGRRGG